MFLAGHLDVPEEDADRAAAVGARDVLQVPHPEMGHRGDALSRRPQRRDQGAVPEAVARGQDPVHLGQRQDLVGRQALDPLLQLHEFGEILEPLLLGADLG